jgi:hypothetical protein
MNIELKNIKHFESLSEETNAFTASVYIEGKRVGTAKNTGHGGETDVYADNELGRDLINRAEAYFKSLPPKHYPGQDGSEGFSFQVRLPDHIDDLLTDHLVKKDMADIQKKINRDMEKGIVVGTPGGYSWYIQTFTSPLASVIAHQKGPEIIANSISKNIFKDLKDGVKILNTNIPENVLKMAGLSEEQYLKPNVADIKTIYPTEGRNGDDNSRNRTR